MSTQTTDSARVLRIGTRGSELATTQAGHVRDALVAAGYPAELHIVRTEGDVNMAPVERIGVGVFVHALRDALERGECDVAVHSYKDLPTAPDERFSPIASPPRALATDVLVARDGLTLAELPEGARVGTSAPRRRAQLAALRPDLDLVPLRGNIDTRMGFVRSGELDAVVLAGAGLERTGRTAEATEKFTPEQMLPAPAQGALAVEARHDDVVASRAVASLADAATMLAVAAERRFLATLEAGCTAPVGALARFEGDRLRLEGVVASVGGARVLRDGGDVVIPRELDAANLAAAAALGDAAAQRLLARGAAEIVAVTVSDERTPLAPKLAPDGAKPGGDGPAGDSPGGG